MQPDSATPRLVGDTPKGGSILGFYMPKGAPRPPRIDYALGIYLYDEFGNRYLDATSGSMVSNLGHSNPRVLKAMAAQAAKVTFAYPRFFESPHTVQLADKVCALAGEGFDRAFFVSGGSEANEAAMKLARQYAVVTGQGSRWKVLSLDPSYHGATLGTVAITGDDFTRSIYEPMLTRMPKVPAPLTYRLPTGMDAEAYAMQCAQALEQTILDEGPESVLAFILEPIGGLASGAIVAPYSYHRAVRDICTRHGVLLIHDEILSGGRTGHFLASQRFPDVRPDLVTLAKGLAAGYTPFGALLAPDWIVDAVASSGGFVHGHTYFSNPLSCAIAEAVLDEIIERELLHKSVSLGDHLRTRLLEVQQRSRLVGDVRGTGLLMAIELVADKASKRQLPVELNAPARLTEHALKYGIALYNRRANRGAYGDIQMITPPLIINHAQIDELCEGLGKALLDLEQEMIKRGLLGD